MTEAATFLSLIHILAAIAGMLLYNSQMQQNVRKRDEELCKDYPEMVEQFVLLVGAGMTIKSAWIKMTDDYQSGLDRKQAKRYLYEEMSVTEREMQNGMGEERAYELFAKRTGIPVSYTHLAERFQSSFIYGRRNIFR